MGSKRRKFLHKIQGREECKYRVKQEVTKLILGTWDLEVFLAVQTCASHIRKKQEIKLLAVY